MVQTGPGHNKKHIPAHTHTHSTSDTLSHSHSISHTHKQTHTHTHIFAHTTHEEETDIWKRKNLSSTVEALFLQTWGQRYCPGYNVTVRQQRCFLADEIILGIATFSNLFPSRYSRLSFLMGCLEDWTWEREREREKESSSQLKLDRAITKLSTITAESADWPSKRTQRDSRVTGQTLHDSALFNKGAR